MGKLIPLNGRRFGRLLVLNREENPGGKVLWNCLCDCGNFTIVSSDSLLRKPEGTKSCGCLWYEQVAKSTKHGFKRRNRKIPSEYIIWCQIKQRCYDTNHISYHNYGGRGIKVCDRWAHSFENFLEDMGEKPSSKHSIDRIDNNADYSPENCRWATKKVQLRNKRNNRLMTFNGQTKTLVEWSEETGIHPQLIRQRIDRDQLSIKEALTRKGGRRVG